MKLTYEIFERSVKTKSEPSSLVKGLWISRAAIGILVNESIKPLFGFSAGFVREKAEVSSKYELLERLVFLQNIYNEDDLIKPVQYISKDIQSFSSKRVIKEFLNGSMSHRGIFYGNGCAISNNYQEAILHSRDELFERHLCCEIWYKRLPLIREYEFNVELHIPNVNLEFYTINIREEYKFAIAVIDCIAKDFFVFGAAIRPTIEEAYTHSLSEAAMIFEDAIKGRKGYNTSSRLKQILSSRDETFSFERKQYFKGLLQDNNAHKYASLPSYQTITFEPFPNIYAARTFSVDALDPREMELKTENPTLPLF